MAIIEEHYGSYTSFVNSLCTEFDGINEACRVPGANVNTHWGNGTTDQPFTMNAFVYLISMPFGNAYLFSKDSSAATREYNFFITNAVNRRPSVQFVDASTAGRIERTASSYTVPLGTWVMLTATYDGSGNDSSSNMKLYADGVPLATSPNSLGLYTAMEQTIAPLRFGYNFRSGEFSNFKLKDVTMWDRFLSDAEVAQLRDGGGNPVDPTSLAFGGDLRLWWRGGDGAGDIYPVWEDQQGLADAIMDNMSSANFVAYP